MMHSRTLVSALAVAAIALTAVFFFAPQEAQAKKVEVYSRTFLRPDKSRTVSIRDDNKMRKELRTYSSRGILIWKGIYRLDKYGRPRSAEIFDAQNKLLFKAAYGFDQRGRLRQERFFSGKGSLLRIIDYPYDRYGKKLKPIARNGQYALIDVKDGYASTHPDLLGVKQAEAAKRAGRPVQHASSRSAGSRTSRYGAPTSRGSTAAPSTTRRPTTNTSRNGSSSLRLNLKSTKNRYRNR